MPFIKHNFALKNFKEDYRKTCIASYGDILSPSMCDVYNCSKSMNLRYIFENGGLFELPGFWKIPQIRQFIEHHVQWAYIDRQFNRRDKLLIFIFDDAQQFLPPLSDVSWLSSIFPTCIERRMVFWTVIHIPQLTNTYLFSNSAIKFVFGLEDGKDKEIMAKALDINLRSEERVFDQPPGRFITRKSGQPILCEFEEQHLKNLRMDDEQVDEYMEQFYELPELSWQPRVSYEEILKARAPIELSSMDTKTDKSKKLSYFAELVVKDAAILNEKKELVHLWDTKDMRFERVSITYGSRKQATSEELTLTHPFFSESNIKSYGTLWEPLDAFHEYTNVPRQKIRGKGNFKCKFMSYMICNALGLDPNKAIEFNSVDVAYRDESGRLIGYEIESEESDGNHVKINGIRDLLKDPNVDSLTFVCENRSLMKKIKGLIETCPELEFVKCKVKYELWSKFFPKKQEAEDE